jgi:geranylgeranyl diphosphate synthase type I
MTPSLKLFMAEHAGLVRQAVTEYFVAQKKRIPQQAPHFCESIETLEEFSLRGGKGIRGMLVVLGYLIGGGEIESNSPIYQVAGGVELFHKHLLSLDDVADRDELRNGGQTLWKTYQTRFGEVRDGAHHARTMAEIDATLLGSFATEMIRTADIPAEARVAILGVINSVMYWETISGWQIHYYQNLESLDQANEADYIWGQEKVTAEYTFVGPLSIGLLAAGQKLAGKLATQLAAYGRAVGTAFQMRDDILGLFGNSDETGKPVGNDVREGKKTLLLQHAYRAASAADRQFLAEVCGGEVNATSLARVQKIVRETGALKRAEELAHDSVQKGISELNKIAQRPELVQILKDLANFVVEREK